mmetsp:Transcript_12325/g.23218  ORF Transcript_12325/g.23218 Transcript_12325/m.23218 type:complete len:252 (+) Transcript_12325:823-1578(+)
MIESQRSCSSSLRSCCKLLSKASPSNSQISSLSASSPASPPSPRSWFIIGISWPSIPPRFGTLSELDPSPASLFTSATAVAALLLLGRDKPDDDEDPGWPPAESSPGFATFLITVRLGRRKPEPSPLGASSESFSSLAASGAGFSFAFSGAFRFGSKNPEPSPLPSPPLPLGGSSDSFLTVSATGFGSLCSSLLASLHCNSSSSPLACISSFASSDPIKTGKLLTVLEASAWALLSASCETPAGEESVILS